MANRKGRKKFIFQKQETIGAEGAEQDQQFLSSCFVDTGHQGFLQDTNNPKSIVLGRTGAGKTALLLNIKEEQENVAWLEPDQLALQYLANSTILRYLEDLGVKLDIFYRLLWRHIFAVELIKLKYQVRNKNEQTGFFERMSNLFFGDKRKEEALKYLIEWGEHFWEDTEYRVHEVTEKLEEAIKSKIGLKAKYFEAGFQGGESISLEERKEIKHRAQEVVNAVQIQKLSKVIEILAQDVFSDSLQKYFIIIDRLDEEWVDENLRYRLIRALVETVKDLQKITNAKVILALRNDLIERVFRVTRDGGFQEEKYNPLFLRLQWSKDQILTVLSKRIARLAEGRTNKESISWPDVFPKKIAREETGEYLVKRTMYRPRDIIQFANCCIEFAEGKSEISSEMVREAERKYSDMRFRSLGYEWVSDYPDLLDFAELLKKQKSSFNVPDISKENIQSICINSIGMGWDENIGELRKAVQKVFEGTMDLEQLRLLLVKIFYKVGLIGVKPDPSARTIWSYLEREMLREAEISDTSRLEICPMFFRILGIDTR